MSHKLTKVRATVTILTYNGEDYLRQILEALRIQEYEPGFEVLIIDSGSTDSTLSIIADFPDVRLHEIPNTEFGHGKTRNLAATLAKGEFVAFLTHDAVPLGPHWLAELVAPFDISPRVAGVFGLQVPRPNAMPTIRLGILGTFASIGAPESTTLYELREHDGPDIGWKAFYSDVNSATRRSILLRDIPYHEVDYAEDQLFGRDLLRAGLIKAYAARAAVAHSNDLTLRTYGPRIYDETFGLREAGLIDGLPTRLHSVRTVIKMSVHEIWMIARDRGIGRKRRVLWCVLTPAVQWTRERYWRLALSADLGDSREDRYSLEQRLRRTTEDDPNQA